MRPIVRSQARTIVSKYAPMRKESHMIGLATAGGALSIISIAPFLAIVAVAALEFLIAFLQAYVFAILTCIYLNDALNLHEH